MVVLAVLALLGWVALVDYRASPELLGTTTDEHLLSLPTVGLYVSTWQDTRAVLDIELRGNEVGFQAEDVVVEAGEGLHLSHLALHGPVSLTFEADVSEVDETDVGHPLHGSRIPRPLHYRGTYEFELPPDRPSLLWLLVDSTLEPVRVWELLPAHEGLFGRSRRWRRHGPSGGVCGVTLTNETEPPQTLTAVEVTFGDNPPSYTTTDLPPGGRWYIDAPVEGPRLGQVMIHFSYADGSKGHLEWWETDRHVTLGIPMP